MQHMPLAEPKDLITNLKYALEHSLDMTEIAQARVDLASHGGAAIVPLLTSVEQGLLPNKVARQIVQNIGPSLAATDKPHILAAAQRHAEQGQDVDSRVLALELVAEHIDHAVHGGHAMLLMAQDLRVPRQVRAQALRAIARVRLDTASLGSLVAMAADQDSEVALAALAALEMQAEQVSAPRATEVLSGLLHSKSDQVRRRAIELLGVFGEIDQVERLCALPLADPQDIEAVQRMVRRMLTKPRSLIHISSTSFEHLVMRLLVAMGFEDAKVTGRTHDGGIDVTAIREELEGALKKERRFYIVQCKRHRNPIGPQMIDEFINALKGRPAAHGLFITTAVFTPDARRAIGAYRLQLVDRDELQQHLDRHFGVNQYRTADL